MSCPKQTLTIKRGDTFGYAGKGSLPAGTWTASAHARKRDLSKTKVADLTCTLTPLVADLDGKTHALSVEKDAETSSDSTSTWPIDTLDCDVQFRDSLGVVASTQTFEIRVQQDVTHA